MTAPDPRRELDVPLGRVDVLHTLALAVRPRDAVTTRPVVAGIRVGIETTRARVASRRRLGDQGPLDPALRSPTVALDPGSAFVLRRTGHHRANVVVRVDDPSRRLLPRRFAVALWEAVEPLGVRGAPRPATGPIPAESRLLLPWLLPGPAYRFSAGTTGVRLSLSRGGRSLRWARVEAFGEGGQRIAWTHGDEHGEALLLAPHAGAIPPPVPATFDIALRIASPDPVHAAAVDPGDALADVPLEAVPRSSVPPRAEDLDNDLLRGITAPSGYVGSPDLVLTLTVGAVIAFAHDIPSSPQP